jgi:hypothetical protein
VGTKMRLMGILPGKRRCLPRYAVYQKPLRKGRLRLEQASLKANCFALSHDIVISRQRDTDEAFLRLCPPKASLGKCAFIHLFLPNLARRRRIYGPARDAPVAAGSAHNYASSQAAHVASQKYADMSCLCVISQPRAKLGERFIGHTYEFITNHIFDMIN